MNKEVESYVSRLNITSCDDDANDCTCKTSKQIIL